MLALISLANYANFDVYDSIGPVAELLQRQRGFSDSQIGMLNAIYCLPNILLLLLGGMLVDRYGAARMMFWTAVICLGGAILTAQSPGFRGMAAGRLLFGIGADTFNIATLAAVVKYFSGRNLAFAVATSIAVGRAGAVVRPASGHFSLRGILGFGPAYWYLLVLCALWYSTIFAFRSTFSIKYFQHAHGLDLAAAAAINAWVFLAALFATPAFGWLCDRIGRYAPLLAFGASLLPVSIAFMAMSDGSLWIGTALGLMWVVQSAGMAGDTTRR